MSLFFAGSMYRRAISIYGSRKVFFSKDDCDGLEYYDYFNFKIREYLGLGLLLSFIPGTAAYQARTKLVAVTAMVLNNYFAVVDDPSESYFNEPTIFYKLACKSASYGIVGNLLALGPLWQFLDDLTRNITFYDGKARHINWANVDHQQFLPFYDRDYLNIINNRPNITSHDNIFEELASYTPEDWLRNILNPLRLLDNLLLMGYKLISRTLGESTNQIVHGLVSVIFWLILLPIKLLKRIADIPYFLLKNIVYAPLAYIASAIYQSVVPQSNKKYIVFERLTQLFNSLTQQDCYFYDLDTKQWQQIPLEITAILKKLLVDLEQCPIELNEVDTILAIQDQQQRFYQIIAKIIPGFNYYRNIRYSRAETPNDAIVAYQEMRAAIKQTWQSVDESITGPLYSSVALRYRAQYKEEGPPNLYILALQQIDASGLEWLLKGNLNDSPRDSQELAALVQKITEFTTQIKAINSDDDLARLNQLFKLCGIPPIEKQSEPKPKKPEAKHQWRYKGSQWDNYRSPAAQVDSEEQARARKLFGLSLSEKLDKEKIKKIKLHLLSKNSPDRHPDNTEKYTKICQDINSAFDALFPEEHAHRMQSGGFVEHAPVAEPDYDALLNRSN